MRSTDQYLSDIEADRRDREAEIRTLFSQLPQDKDSEEGKPFRRSLVLLIYAHFEGSVRFALYTYLTAINARKIEFRDASIPVGCASADSVFRAVIDPQKKSDVFREKLPDDSSIHRLARFHEFVEKYENSIGDRIVSISESALNFESNLKPEVLKRNLYVLGLPIAGVDEDFDQLGKLLGVRNAVAHGDRLRDPKFEFVNAQFESTLRMMAKIQSRIQDALEKDAFLRGNELAA